MPPKLIPTFVKFNSNEKRDRVPIVADIRLGDSFSDIFGVLDELKEDEINYKILFIDADNDVIMRRYQETRRKHPLADEFNTPSILEAIQKERAYELAFEGHRRLDLIRWGIYSETIEETYNALKAWWDEREDDKNTLIPNYVIYDYTEKGKHELMPIPQREMDLCTQFNQNPKW